MGWIRDLFTGSENEREAVERYPGTRDSDLWRGERGGLGRDAGEWRAARDAWHSGGTRSWSEHPRVDPGGTFSGSPSSQRTGWWGVPQSIDMSRDTSRGVWGSEGSGGAYQGDLSRERAGRERPYGQDEDSGPSSVHWRPGFSEGAVQADPAEPAFGYGVGALMPPTHTPSGSTNWTPESRGSFAVGESIYGRSVIKPDAMSRRRGRTSKGWRRDDQRIQEDVSDRLTDDPRVDASEIEVLVSGSVVTLRGTVADRSTKYLAEDLAEDVFGVLEVHNDLRVPRESSLGLRSSTAGDGLRGPR